jgi:superfamily II DNA or RNA helicase
VPSRQLNHLNLIKRALEDEGWDGPIYLLRGEENELGDAQKIVQAIEAGGIWSLDKKKLKKEKIREWVQTESIGEHGHEAVILSTVADEGMDIPMIDREHICFPMRQEAALIQLIGRGERISPNKKDYVITDYRDSRCTIFAEQAHERLRVYRYQGLEEEPKVNNVEDYIEWWQVPEQNETWYRHVGCDGSYFKYMAPMDDCPPPSGDGECPNCIQIRPLRPRQLEVSS